jgi:hypothetical protein
MPQAPELVVLLSVAAAFVAIYSAAGLIREPPRRGRAAMRASREAGRRDGDALFGPCGICGGRHFTAAGRSVCEDLRHLDRSLRAWVAVTRQAERQALAEREVEADG